MNEWRYELLLSVYTFKDLIQIFITTYLAEIIANQTIYQVYRFQSNQMLLLYNINVTISLFWVLLLKFDSSRNLSNKFKSNYIFPGKFSIWCLISRIFGKLRSHVLCTVFFLLSLYRLNNFIWNRSYLSNLNYPKFVFIKHANLIKFSVCFINNWLTYIFFLNIKKSNFYFIKNIQFQYWY